MIEVNGPANIIMEIDVALALGRPVNLEMIRRQAQYTNFYLRLIAEKGIEKNPTWFQSCGILDEKEKKSSDYYKPIQP